MAHPCAIRSSHMLPKTTQRARFNAAQPPRCPHLVPLALSASAGPGSPIEALVGQCMLQASYLCNSLPASRAAAAGLLAGLIPPGPPAGIGAQFLSLTVACNGHETHPQRASRQERRIFLSMVSVSKGVCGCVGVWVGVGVCVGGGGGAGMSTLLICMRDAWPIQLT